MILYNNVTTSLFSLSRYQNYKMQTIKYRINSRIWEMKEDKYAI